MPGKNVIKIYKNEAFYHVYNRGVDKCEIFRNKKDYKKFLEYLYKSSLRINIRIHCYCLMPNHFHILLSQGKSRNIERFMRSLLTKYVLFFNHKYDRVGRLFQGTYRARLIENETDLITTSAYIHNNPRKDNPRINLENYPYSSFKSYIEKTDYSWIDVDTIKSHFIIEDYKIFVDRMGDFEVDLGLS